MLNGDMARYRTDDLLRAGDAYRRSRSGAERVREMRVRRRRRVITTAIAMLPIPVKH